MFRRIAAAGLVCAFTCGAQPQELSKAFEFRFVSNEPAANGETDFKGSTEVFDTEERVAFLSAYAEYAKRFFDDPKLDTDVVPMAEAVERLARIKEQPLPQVRQRIPLRDWRWLGYRAGGNAVRQAAIEAWSQPEGVAVANGALRVTGGSGQIAHAIPEQSWRYFIEWKAFVPDGGRVAFEAGDNARVVLEDGMVKYETAGEYTNGAEYTPGTWLALRLEADLEEKRYNLIVDGAKVADFVPLASTGASSVDAMRIAGTRGAALDDLWGMGFVQTDDVRHPIRSNPFIDENFELKPPPDGWNTVDYDASTWQEGQLPIIHGTERHAGEDLYIRTRVEVGPFERAVLEVESLAPHGEVWVNGVQAATVESPEPARIDLTKHLQPNAANTLAIKVNHGERTEPAEHGHYPSDVEVGWYAARMWLNLTADTHIEDVRMHTAEIGNPAYIQPHITVRNEGTDTFEGAAAIRLYPWFPEEADRPVAEVVVPVTIAPGSVTVLEQVVPLADPKLWTPDSPNLYKAEAVLLDADDRPIDDYVITTGVRTFGQGGGTFRINGEPALSRGALLLGYRPPMDELVLSRAWTPDEWIVRELMQIQRMRGDTARTGFILASNPRFAEIGDQLGVMFIWQTPAGRWWGDPMEVDFGAYPGYMRQVYNHPSVMMWEVANEPHVEDYEHLNEFYATAYDTLYPVDQTRLICVCTNLKHTRYSGNDSGTIDLEGNPNPYPHVPQWTDRMVTRGHHIHPTGYGKPWSVLREWPGSESSFLDSLERAYFNTEHEESIGQPNWELRKGEPSYRVHSYEWRYDEGSIGRRLTTEEWQASQGWQAFSAYESMRKQRIMGIDGFSWCCLHGGPNAATYEKPLLDFFGHAKLSYWAVRMANQDVLAGSADVDVVYGPEDAIHPVVLNLGTGKRVGVTVAVKDTAGATAAKKVYENVALAPGRTVTELPPFKPALTPNGYYAVEYTIESR